MVENKTACIYFESIPNFSKEEQNRLAPQIKIFLAKHQEAYNKFCLEDK